MLGVRVGEVLRDGVGLLTFDVMALDHVDDEMILFYMILIGQQLMRL